MSGRTIVVIEDEAAIAGAVAARLRSEGFRVELAATGPSGVELCRRLAPDLVVLDWMLPGFDGIEACRRIQADQPVPVLFLTARDAEADVLVGLGIGADDYLTKPFSPRELVARVHAILRRAARSALAEPPARVEVGPYVLDLDARRVRRDGEEIRVTPTELDLLATLAGRPGRAFSRAELLAEVWGWRAGGSTAHRRLPRGRAAPQARRGRRAHGAGPRLRARRPGVAVLARVPSLKLKLGLVIVLAIVVTLATLLIAAELGLRLRWGASRPSPSRSRASSSSRAAWCRRCAPWRAPPRPWPAASTGSASR